MEKVTITIELKAEKMDRQTFLNMAELAGRHLTRMKRSYNNLHPEAKDNADKQLDRYLEEGNMYQSHKQLNKAP